ncbi:MAG: hypothetical protein L3J37_11605 [Rhodobacteraceae bacterium]|nr:hypothetical protein [Paracoccaceae bacterium]
MNIDDMIANGTITFENGRSDLNAEQEAAEILTITEALKTLWNNEAYRVDVFDKLDIVEGKVLRIGLLEDSATGFSNIAIVDSQYTLTYLDNTGTAQTGSFLRILAHEVLHAVLNTDDTVDDLTGGQIGPDYLGETVIATNTYMETIDYSMARASYSATGDFLAAEENGQWLWNGDTADVVLVAKGETSQVGGATRPSANVDTSHNTTGLKDLIIGWNGTNNISTGAGDDYIYGRGGADTLNAGEGNDNVMAGTGNDTVIGGLGNDFSNGGADDDTLDYSTLDFTIALDDPAGEDYDALFSATPDSGGWVDRFTDFETVTLSTQDTTLTINGANTLEALNAEAIKTCEVPPIAYPHTISSCFGFVSTAQKWLKKALLPLVLLGASQPALADWEGFGENRTWIVEGQVMSVTRDGFILLRPYGGEEDEIIKIHQWGLKVNAGDLTMITLARRLTCAVLYDTGEYLGGHCYLSFFEDVNDNPIRRGLPDVNIAKGGPLWFIMYPDYGGSAECSQDDVIYGKEIVDQTGLFIACGQSSEAGETE